MAAVLLFLSGYALGQNATIEWVGPTGEWTNPASWIRLPGPGDGPPLSSDVVLIDQPNSFVILEGEPSTPATGTFSSLTLGSNGLVSVQGDATLSGGNVTVGTSSEIATLQVLNAGSFLNLGTVTVASGAGSRGEFNVSSGGVAGLVALIVGNGGTGSVIVGSGSSAALETDAITISGPGSSIDVNDHSQILTESFQISEGSVSITNESLIRVEQVGGFSMAANNTSNATITLSNGTLEILPSSNNTAFIGESGRGSISAENGSTLIFDSLVLGKNALSEGSLIVSDSSLRTYGSISVGAEGTGELVLRDGSTLTAKSQANVLAPIVLGGPLPSSSGLLIIGGNATTTPGTVEASEIVSGANNFLLPNARIQVAHASTNYELTTPLNGAIDADFLAGTTVLTTSSTLGGNLTVAGSATVLVNANFSTINADRSNSVGANATLGGIGSLQSQTNVSGVIAPGFNGIGTLNVVGNVLWNSNIHRPWKWDLGPGNTSDRLSIQGLLVRGSGDLFVFDFGGISPAGSYTLLTWGISNNIPIDDFRAIGLEAGQEVTGFAFDGNSLVVHVIPEPAVTTVAFGIFLILLIFLRRARANPSRTPWVPSSPHAAANCFNHRQPPRHRHHTDMNVVF